MKIVFSTDQIYLHGGIEKVLTKKANYFANLPDTEVVILTTEQKNNSPCYPLDKKIETIDMGIDYNRSLSYFSKANLIKAFKHFRKQKAILKKLKPDVLISPNFNFDHYWLPFIKGKTKLIKERHSSRYKEEDLRKNTVFLSKIRLKFNDWIDSKYDSIVVLNKDEAAYVKTSNAVVIPNPVSRTELISAVDKKQVMAAGRIAPVKAFDELIHIWAMIQDEFPEWELHFFGDDYLDTQSRLEELIQKYRLENQIKFKGSVSDLRQVMQDYSIYSMTSATECFPMVLLESLSVGLPVVSYDCPNGPRNIIRDGEDGFLVENKNREAFAESLKSLMRNQELRKQMSAKAKENSKRFSFEVVMNEWKKLLKL